MDLLDRGKLSRSFEKKNIEILPFLLPYKITHPFPPWPSFVRTCSKILDLLDREKLSRSFEKKRN